MTHVKGAVSLWGMTGQQADRRRTIRVEVDAGDLWADLELVPLRAEIPGAAATYAVEVVEHTDGFRFADRVIGAVLRERGGRWSWLAWRNNRREDGVQSRSSAATSRHEALAQLLWARP